MHRVDSDFQSQLAYNCSPTLAYGLGVLVAGLVILGTALSGFFGRELLLVEVCAGALTVLGLCLTLMRLGLIVDRRLRRVIKRRSFLCPLQSTVYNLSPFDFLTISR